MQTSSSPPSDAGVLPGGRLPPAAPADGLRGLSTAQADERRARYGPNVVGSAARRTWLRALGDVIAEPMFLLLLAASSVYFVLGDVTEALTLLVFVVAIVLLTVFQSHRTARVLESLRELSAPRAQVLRDGQRRLVSAADLVPGDVVFVDEGARVPADGVVAEAHELSVDESMLTGESVPVTKSVPPGTRNADDSFGRLFFGTMVVQGQGRMIVDSIGADTALGRIGKSLTGIQEARSPLQRETRTFVNRFAVVAVALCLMLVLAYRWRFGDWLAGILAGVTLAMGILPQEIPVILTVFMALGARRIANEGVLTRRMSAIETLGQTSVLCVDKTGTLTQNRMSVRVLAAHGERQVVDPATPRIEPAFHELIEYLVLASEIEPVDPMEIAFHEAGRTGLAGTGRLHADWLLDHEYALTPELPAMSHAWRTREPGRHAVACKGAPEAVCDLCHLDPRETREVLDEAARMASGGLRVLGVAKARHAEAGWPDKQHDFAFTFVGLVGLLDPVRPEAAGAIAECRAAGIRVVMITGDYPSTARAIAAEVGIDATRIVTGQEVAAMDDAALNEAIGHVDTYARVKPEQKLRLVNALRQSGQVVAMTGDGVNDAPALKAAHIGIAMGLRGAEVAREVASLVLLRDDFAPIVFAIRLGRRIYANLVQAISYTVAVHIPMIAAAMVPVFVGWPPMLAPVHIVFLELIINPVCSVVFENEPAREDLMRVPPRRAGARLLSNRTLAQGVAAGILAAIAVLAVYAVLLAQGQTQVYARTFAFLALVASNVGLIFVVRLLRHTGRRSRALGSNRTLWTVVGATAAVLVLLMSVPALAGLFGLVALLRP
ncbi:cation-translocating P-type ATPase [Bordetella genomosp. 11]|uniref:P-type Cu(+) transporter n=1 Tax=Bordetella genomosp. 11 TaxID=1416808 RepID=A0A261UQ31_9BORD|nr:cation-translocating P-type ATPase [Bordetella genomosp. 11]OZI63380.1 ATPase [Bordetella genomosp. 11]